METCTYSSFLLCVCVCDSWLHGRTKLSVLPLPCLCTMLCSPYITYKQPLTQGHAAGPYSQTSLGLCCRLLHLSVVSTFLLQYWYPHSQPCSIRWCSSTTVQYWLMLIHNRAVLVDAHSQPCNIGWCKACSVVATLHAFWYFHFRHPCMAVYSFYDCQSVSN